MRIHLSLHDGTYEIIPSVRMVSVYPGTPDCKCCEPEIIISFSDGTLPEHIPVSKVYFLRTLEEKG